MGVRDQWIAPTFDRHFAGVAGSAMRGFRGWLLQAASRVPVLWEQPTAGPAWPAGFAGGERCSGFLWERSIDRDADVEKVQVRDQRAGSRSMDRSHQNITSFLRLERG